MKHVAQSLTLGLAVLAAGTISTRAADWAVGSNGAFGSVKDYRNAAVPVPAPTPSQTPNKDWYIRGDFGYNFASDTSVSSTGAVLSTDSGQNIDGFLFGSVGMGRYITPNLRAELSLDYRPTRQITKTSQTSTTVLTVVNPAGTITDRNTYTITQQDDAKSSDQNVFVNLYYDFARSGRFTPYVGAGLGVDARRFKRTSSQNVSCTSGTSTDTSSGAPVVTTYTGFCPSPNPDVPYNADNNKDSFAYGVAAALMFGASYEIAAGMQIDSGYRVVWQGAEVELGGRGYFSPSTISISDKLDHEFRTGIRIDLN